MSQKQLNLGILAHVDAGKTTLTERLLYEAGVIDAPGSVDAGTTQTDSLELERRRGITIKSAVTSFALDDVHVNLIDTPGHPDFIAEVERVLSVLDGVVLVVSAVEGVQPQTRILMRALQRLALPTVLFVNKIDRAGADTDRVLRAVAERLTPAVVAMGTAEGLGTRAASVTPARDDDAAWRVRLAEALAEHDDRLLAAFVEDDALPTARLRLELAAQTRRAIVHPVYFGSAITGAGVRPLMAGIAELLPAPEGETDGPVAATVFKIERAETGEKIAYVRVFSGTIRTRDSLRLDADREGKVTAIEVFDRGPAEQRPSVSAGGVARLRGLADARIGDRIGAIGAVGTARTFPPPTLESVVVAGSADERARLRTALGQLAEADPLIDVQQDDERGELSVSLYGEVQREVIEATLAEEYGIAAVFRETTPIYVERPAGAGQAIERLHAQTNPYLAEIELRVEPAADDAGVEFRLDVDSRTIPLYVYKTLAGFTEQMRRYVGTALQEGLFGWRVTDCLVTLTHCAYSIPDGPPSRRGPPSTAADFRQLTPIVLEQALARAGTVVCKPMLRVSLDAPTATLGAVMAALARLGATFEPPSPEGALSQIEAVLAAAKVGELQRQLPALTGGEGALESAFAGYRPVAGEPPARRSRRR